MTNVIAVLILGILVGGAAGVVYRAKKRGAKCIGCPVEGGCTGLCSSCAGSKEQE